MRYLKYLLGGMLTAALVACGGGGGSAGTTPGGGGSGTGSGTTGGAIALSLVDSADVALTTNAISKSANYYAKAVVTSSTGAALSNQLVSFTTDFTVATLAGNAAQATALTDSSGVAKVLISPLSLSTAGAASLTASATVNSVALTASLNYATTPSNVTLANITATPGSIGALETAAVTVQGLINGVLATSSNVSVSFTSSCGTFSPSTATTDSNGVASSTFQSNSTCSGAVTLTASANGATPLTRTIVITPAKAANVVFSSATPALMYASSAASGNKTSVLKFQVLDSSSTGLASQSVVFSLSNASIASGVRFSLSGTSSISPQTVTTDSSGFASITVAAGGLPTTVTVTATLASDSTVFASSVGLVVTTGAATQNSASLSASKLSIEAWNTDGVTSALTMRVADRLGNPVPDGTSVNFVATAGLITPGTCITTSSACSVTYTSQGTRPSNGRVAILAYLDGEESFVDLNGDNIWQSGETFYDAGKAFIDLNEDGVWATGEQIIDTSTNASVCVNVTNTYPAIASTCDSTWSSAIRVRKQTVITLATSTAFINCVNRDASQATKFSSPSTACVRTGAGGTRNTGGFTVFVRDTNPAGNNRGSQFGAAGLYNAMPTGSTVSAAITTTGAVCTVKSVSANVVENSPNGDLHDIILSGDADCASVGLTVTVTTPAGVSTTQPF